MLHIEVKPDWSEMVRVNNEAQTFLSSASLATDTINTFTMVTCELVENGIKYGEAFGNDTDVINVDVNIHEKIITVNVINVIGKESRFHLQRLDRTLQWIRGFQDPFQAYLERVKEISRETTTSNRSGLGIVRIAYEARASIDFVVGEDDTLAVSAVAKIG